MFISAKLVYSLFETTEDAVIKIDGYPEVCPRVVRGASKIDLVRRMVRHGLVGPFPVVEAIFTMLFGDRKLILE